MSQKRDNSGTLGANQRREKDSHPTHTGQATIDGKEFWISAWVKDGRDGSRFFSLAFKPKLARDHQGGSKNPPAKTWGSDTPASNGAASAGTQTDWNDDIPY